MRLSVRYAPAFRGTRSTNAGLLLILLLTGCTAQWQKPEPIEQVDFRKHAVIQSREGVEVTVAVPSSEETTSLFGTSLYKEGIQPVWIEVNNQSDLSYTLVKVGVDPNYFSPWEASYQRHSGSKETRREMDVFFESMSFKNPARAGASTSGFLFTELDEGFKAINVDLVTDEKLLNFTFVVKVPGLVTDVAQVDLDALYPERVEIADEKKLAEVLASLPCCTTNKAGDKNGDPLNVVLIGDRAEIFSALIRRGWHQTEIVYGSSAWKTAKSFAFGSEYRYSPISPLYVFGRPQDLGMQKARNSIHLRNHMRLWKTQYEYQGHEIYIGQISRDIGVKFNRRTITTHAIDADVDDTRDGLIGDLAYSQSLSAFGYVKGSQASTPQDTHYNLTPDPYYSDGYRAVMFFDSGPTALNEIEVLDWEVTARFPDSKDR